MGVRSVEVRRSAACALPRKRVLLNEKPISATGLRVCGLRVVLYIHVRAHELPHPPDENESFGTMAAITRFKKAFASGCGGKRSGGKVEQGWCAR